MACNELLWNASALDDVDVCIGPSWTSDGTPRQRVHELEARAAKRIMHMPITKGHLPGLREYSSKVVRRLQSVAYSGESKFALSSQFHIHLVSGSMQYSHTVEFRTALRMGSRPHDCKECGQI